MHIRWLGIVQGAPISKGLTLPGIFGTLYKDVMDV
jgi:hypothetical protein